MAGNGADKVLWIGRLTPSVLGLMVTFALLLTLMARPAHAATFTVDRTDDSAAASACTTAVNDCSLRGAITAANSGATGPDTIDFSPGMTTFTLTASQTQNGNPIYENDNAEGDLDIKDDLTIDGGSSSVIIEGGNGWDERVIDIIAAPTPGTKTEVILQKVTVQKGNATFGGLRTAVGGGLRVNGEVSGTTGGASLTLQQSTVTNNTSVQNGGGILEDGGGVSSITLQDSTVSNNTAGTNGDGGGGGIFSTVELTLTNSIVTGNSGAHLGGGLNIAAGEASITDSTISGNTARSFGSNTNGGGIYSQGSVTLTRSTIDNNTAEGGTATRGEGGGLYAIFGSSTQLVNTTVSGNTAQSGSNFGADGRGGGIYFSTSVTLANATITNNTSTRGGGIFGDAGSTATLRNAIVAANNDGLNAEFVVPNLTSQGYNLLGPNPPSNLAPTDIVSSTPGFGPLANNGGPTQTHALLTGSPAIDAANPAAPGSGSPACEANDQRGITRPQDGNADGTARCDIGAFEKAAGADNTPPTLDLATGVMPRNGQRNVARTTNIRATFSEPMNPSSLQANGVFTLKNTKNGSMVSPASITLSPDGKTATFDPMPRRLAKKTRYEVKIKGGTGGASDVAGNVLAADAVWSFTTKRR